MGNQHAIYFCGGILHASVMVMVVGDKGVTLHVTLLGDVMVDVFIFIVDVGNWRHCSHNSAMVLFSQLGCSL